MKTHFAADAPATAGGLLYAEAPCGAGKGVSQYGVACTSLPSSVDCMRCIRIMNSHQGN